MDESNVTATTTTGTPDQYRFSGYNLPMLQLDSTGDAYYYIPTPHPYYIGQPTYYQKPVGYGGGAPVTVATTVAPAEPVPINVTTKSGLYPLQSL